MRLKNNKHRRGGVYSTGLAPAAAYATPIWGLAASRAKGMRRQAAQAYGLPYNPDFNGASTYGVGSYQLTIGRRFRA